MEEILKDSQDQILIMKGIEFLQFLEMLFLKISQSIELIIYKISSQRIDYYKFLYIY